MSLWELLAFRYLLLNESDSIRVFPVKNYLAFNVEYPSPTFLLYESWRIIQELMRLEREGYIQITDIKIDNHYLVFYDNPYKVKDIARAKLAKAAPLSHYGLSKEILAKVRKGLSLTVAELSGVLELDGLAIAIKHTELSTFIFGPPFGNGPDRKNPENYLVKHFLNFPEVIAQYVSLDLKINREKITAALSSQIAAFKEGAFRKQGGRYFGHLLQRQILISMLKHLAKKQESPKLTWRIGYWDRSVYPDTSFKDDELMSVMNKDYPDNFSDWQPWPAIATGISCSLIICS